MPIPSCIHVFIFPHIFGAAGHFLIIHYSFMGISHATKTFSVFILHVFSCLLMVHVQEIRYAARE